MKASLYRKMTGLAHQCGAPFNFTSLGKKMGVQFASLRKTIDSGHQVTGASCTPWKFMIRIIADRIQGCHQGYALLLALILVLTPLAPGPVTADRGDDEIARVNGVSITRREFQTEYRLAVDQHVKDGLPVNEAHLASVRRSVIRRMVEEELLYQESRQAGIVVTNAEINQEVAAARARFKDPETFNQELAQRYLDETGYRRKLHRQRAIARLLEKRLATPSTVTEEEIRRFYDANPQRFHVPEKIRLRHIFIRGGADEGREHDSPTRRKIDSIRDRAMQGEGFADLAQQFSEESEREKGGDLGYVQRGQMLPQLESAVFELPAGSISPVLTTDKGYHLFQITDRQPERSISLDEARPQIRQTLHQLSQDRAVRAFIDGLVKNANIHSTY